MYIKMQTQHVFTLGWVGYRNTLLPGSNIFNVSTPFRFRLTI